MTSARNSYYATKASVRELDNKLKRRDDLTVQLQDVERNLNRFEEAGHAATLTAYRSRNRQRREIDRQFETTEEAAGRIESAADELQVEDLPDGLFDEASEEDRRVVEIVANLHTAVLAARQSLRDAAQRLRESTGTQRAELIASAWQTVATQAAADYDSLVEALQKEGVADPSEYGRLVQERQKLESEVAQLESDKEERNRLEQLSREQLNEVVEARRAINDARNEFLSSVLAQNEFVRIQTCPYGDEPQAIERSLREVLGDNEHFESDILIRREDGTIAGCVADLLAGLSSDSTLRRLRIRVSSRESERAVRVSVRWSG